MFLPSRDSKKTPDPKKDSNSGKEFLDYVTLMNLHINQKLVKNKMGLINLAEELGNVAKACRMMGYSRDTFYRYRQLVDEGGFENLVEKTVR